MLGNTDAHWRHWGETDPYYAVLSADKFRKASFAGHAREFFESGFSQADEVVAILQRHFGDLRFETALDFGCGVGRVLIGLARHYRTVVGIDVSDHMLDETRRNLERFGLGNAVLTKSDDQLSNMTANFDLIHTYIVLQHIPVRRGRAIIQAMLERLAPDGAIALHVCLRRNLSARRRLLYHVRQNCPPVHCALNLLRGRRWNEPLVQMNQYDLVEILELFAAHGMPDTLVMPEVHGDYSTATLLGRKRPTAGA